MIASPNFVRFVYDGDGSERRTAGPDRLRRRSSRSSSTGSTRQGLATEPTAFDGRSDYGPFIARGAPAGGLFSGAEGVKTAEQAAVYGGTAGEAVRPLLPPGVRHISNLNTPSFDQLGDGAATALATFAFTKKPVTATTSRKVSRRTAKQRMARATFRGSSAQR